MDNSRSRSVRPGQLPRPSAVAPSPNTYTSARIRQMLPDIGEPMPPGDQQLPFGYTVGLDSYPVSPSGHTVPHSSHPDVPTSYLTSSHSRSIPLAGYTLPSPGHSTPAPGYAMPPPSRHTPFPSVAGPTNPPQPAETSFMDLLTPVNEAEKSLPETFGGDHFTDIHDVASYLNQVAWVPTMGRWGVPTGAAQVGAYVKRIQATLLNTRNTWDEHDAPLAFTKFTSEGGEWLDDKYVEAIAIDLVRTVLAVHIRGVKGPAFNMSPEYQSHAIEDKELTFPQRMFLLCYLLQKSKRIANAVFLREGLLKYVALPMTTLRSFEQFRRKEAVLAPERLYKWLYVQPYCGSGSRHPTVQEQEVLRAISHELMQRINQPKQSGVPHGQGPAPNSQRTDMSGLSGVPTSMAMSGARSRSGSTPRTGSTSVPAGSQGVGWSPVPGLSPMVRTSDYRTPNQSYPGNPGQQPVPILRIPTQHPIPGPSGSRPGRGSGAGPGPVVGPGPVTGPGPVAEPWPLRAPGNRRVFDDSEDRPSPSSRPRTGNAVAEASRHSANISNAFPEQPPSFNDIIDDLLFDWLDGAYM